MVLPTPSGCGRWCRSGADDARSVGGDPDFEGAESVPVSLSRAWAVWREAPLTLRAESVNFFNTPQFAEPGPELSSPDFGQITNTLNDGRAFRVEVMVGF